MKTKNKGFYATLTPFKKKEVRYLQPYYFQNGAWHKQEDLYTPKKGGKKNVSKHSNRRISKP